jgi:hypothetical protein
VQQEIIDELQRNRANWVVAVDRGISTEPNLSAASGGVHRLDDFLRAEFAPVAEFGRYRILRRIGG